MNRRSGFKERDDEHRSRHSHAYGKKRFEAEDRASQESSRKDALTDFRAGISEDEAYRLGSRHHDELAVSSDSHRRRCDKRAHTSEHGHSRSYSNNWKSSDKRTAKDVSPTCHYRQSTSDEAERLELYNRPSETRSSCFGQDLKGQSERRGRSISRTGSARSNSRPSLSSTHSHKRRRQRSRSKSISRDSKSRKHKRSPKESRRSVLTGKKIKLKVKRSRGDEEQDANRQELLQFLNSAYE